MIILVDKPFGLTSFDVIRALRHGLGIKKIGHSGTLDPHATGVMILATDKDTKKLNNLIGLDKTYEATIDLSQESDTRDLEFRDHHVQHDISTLPVPTLEQIKETLNKLISPLSEGEGQGVRMPLPPFSAKKIKGKRSYEIARKCVSTGKETAEIREQEMKIHNIEIIEYQFPILKIKVDVGSGTYIRSIAYWIGKQLGTRGILTKLHRTQVGKYNLDENTDRQTTSGQIRDQEYTMKYKEITE